jgi:hypothetical protein
MGYNKGSRFSNLRVREKKPSRNIGTIKKKDRKFDR